MSFPAYGEAKNVISLAFFTYAPTNENIKKELRNKRGKEGRAKNKGKKGDLKSIQYLVVLF